MARKKSGVNEAFNLNIKSKNFHKLRMKLMATNMFKWEGLPDNIPQKFIEETLYNHGMVAIANHKKYGFICCKCNIEGGLNMYDEGRKYRLYANNGFSEVFDKDDIVIIRNNNLELPTNVLSEYYVKKLVELDRTIDTNVIMQKTSKILICDESQRMTLINLLMQHEGNVPFIFGNKNMDIKTFDTLDLKAEYVADKLEELSEKTWGNWLDTIGINNANTTKKERQITDEVNSNNQLIKLSSDIFLHSRQLGAEEMNEKWGLNSSVVRKTDIEEEIDTDEKEEGEE